MPPAPLAILAELSSASLVLNELAETRAELLSLLFPRITVTRFDAAQIDDHLDTGIKPSVVLMNPPFSAVANVDRRMADAALRHIASALARLPEGGRLVAITGASCSPDNPVWRDAFIRFQERGHVVFTAAIVVQVNVAQPVAECSQNLVGRIVFDQQIGMTNVQVQT